MAAPDLVSSHPIPAPHKEAGHSNPTPVPSPEGRGTLFEESSVERRVRRSPESKDSV